MAIGESKLMHSMLSKNFKKLAIKMMFGKYHWVVPEEERDMYAFEKDIEGWKHSLSLQGDEPYKLTKWSKKHPGVPKGKLVKGKMTSTKYYPESVHNYKVYVPAKYDKNKTYPLMIFLDGIDFFLSGGCKANLALDNLIDKNKIPAMIAVFLNPGDHGEGIPGYGGFSMPGGNRSLEYDSVDDTFAKFLEEEFLPIIYDKYNVTRNPEWVGIAGGSSSANAAFNVAWLRPDLAQKVLSYVGSFIDIRGAHIQPNRVRTSKKQPLRIALQDGSRDLNVMQGNWNLANQEMVSALDYRGYDYKFTFGEGGHSQFHCGEILPEDLMWLWRDFDEKKGTEG